MIQARLQSNVDAYTLISVRGYPLSFSLGIIQIDLDSTFSVDALLARADAAMYEHKQAKRGNA